MSFYGCTFSFDGVSSSEFGLVLYDVGSTKQNSTTFATTAEIQEDRIPNRYKSLFYGAYVNEPLSFPMVFGLHPDLYNAGQSFDRSDLQKIASWLTGRNGYAWLVVFQDDMFFARYRCFIQDLSVVSSSAWPVALSCTVYCDSPYAYLPREVQEFRLSDGESITIINRSSMNTPYYPKIRIEGLTGDHFSMLSKRENRLTELSTIPGNPGAIEMDCENEILTCENNLNLYQSFNFIFPRLLRGSNQFTVSGSGKLIVECDFPINIGN